MPHSSTDILSHFQRIAGLSDHATKKAALFDTIHSMVAKDAAEAKALGATDAMLAPFTETMKAFEAHKAQIVATDLL
jgi:hypothetical protein